MHEFSVDPHKLEEMLTYCTGFAKQMLEAHGEFHPFGATLSTDGEVGAVGASTGEEFPPGAELAQVLIKAFQSQFAEGAILAAALATNVDIPAQFDPQFPDGIRVTLGCEGYSRHVYLPYHIVERGVMARLARKPREIVYGEMFSVDIAPWLTKTNG
jgi:hypothetical protein